MKKISFIIAFSLISFFGYNQCAMCTKTAAGLDDKSAKGLNAGIIFLALMPLALIGSVGFIWYRNNKNEF